MIAKFKLIFAPYFVAVVGLLTSQGGLDLTRNPRNVNKLFLASLLFLPTRQDNHPGLAANGKDPLS
jgi:hypothetical protein